MQEVVIIPEYVFIPESEGAFKGSRTNCKNRNNLINKKRNNDSGVRYIKRAKIHEFIMTLKQIPYDLLEDVGEPIHNLENINKRKK